MAKSTTYVAKSPDQNGLIAYDRSEDAVWRDLMRQQLPAVRNYAATAYLEGLDRLGLPEDRVPQAAEISEELARFTGWKVQPVPALIGFERFFSMLASRTFPAASFIRRREDFAYIEEPDIFHEIFGHTPLLTDPRFANFSQKIGETGLKAAKSDYSWLIRLYWFSIEFGLTRENGTVRALGSGLASSATELEYSVKSPLAQRRLFDVIDVLRTPYRIDIHQPLYYVIEDLDDLFALAERDLIGDIRKAQSLGLFEPLYEKRASA